MKYVWAVAFFVGILTGVSSVVAQENVSGSFALRMGDTQFPIYPRGDGNPQSWQFDQYLRLHGKQTVFIIRTRLIGGTIMDNPDQFAFDLEFRRQIGKAFVIVFHDDAYSLNREPVPDFTARLPHSSVNSWQVGVGFGGLQARYTWSGVTPLYYGHFTNPYVKYSVHTDWSVTLLPALVWTTQATLSAGNHLQLGNTLITSGLWVSLSGRIRCGAEYIGRFNHRVPAHLGGRTRLPDRQGIFGVVEISFGKK